MSSLVIASTLHKTFMPHYLRSLSLFYPAIEKSEGTVSSADLPYKEKETLQYMNEFQEFIKEGRPLLGSNTHCLNIVDEIDIFSDNTKKTILSASQKAHTLLLIAYILEAQKITFSPEIENFNRLCLNFQSLFAEESTHKQYLIPLKEDSTDIHEHLFFAALTHFTTDDILFVSPSISLFEHCFERKCIQNLPENLLSLCDNYGITSYVKGYMSSYLEDFLPSFSHLSSKKIIRCIFCFEENIV